KAPATRRTKTTCGFRPASFSAFSWKNWSGDACLTQAGRARTETSNIVDVGCMVQAEGRAIRQSAARTIFWLASVRQRVRNRDRRIDFHRLSVQDRGPVAPLADRVQRRLDEEGVATNNLQ